MVLPPPPRPSPQSTPPKPPSYSSTPTRGQRSNQPKESRTPRPPPLRRHVPSDKFFEEGEQALAQPTPPAELLSLVCRLAPTPVEKLHRMWIPCKQVSQLRLDGIMDALGSDIQPEVWKTACQANQLRDFKVIPGAGIGFSCIDYAVAIKIGDVELRIADSTVRVARFSRYASRYYVDLTRLADEVTDTAIFEYFSKRGATPSCICPTICRNGMSSRSRTVYFPQDLPPACLVPATGAPLREIQFTDPNDPAVLLRPCFVQHKVARYNRTVPPSLRKLPHATHPTQGHDTEPVTSLQASLQTEPAHAGSVPAEPSPPAFDDETLSSEASDLSSDNDCEPMSENESMEDSSLDATVEVTGPKTPPSQPWLRVQRNMRAVFDATPPPSQQVVLPKTSQLDDGAVIAYEFNAAPNYYHVLWAQYPEDDKHVHSADAIAGSADGDSPVVSVPRPRLTNYAKALSAATHVFEVEKMTRAEVLAFINDFLRPLPTKPDAQLATIHANPLRHCASFDTVPKAAPFEDRWKVANPHLRSHAKPKTQLKALLLKHIPDHCQQLLRDLTLMARWDLALQLLAPGIYGDPYKLWGLLGIPPSMYAGSVWPLVTDDILIALAHSSVACQALELRCAPAHVLQTLQEHASLIALQETKFSSADALAKNDYFIKHSDANAQAFWSHSSWPEFTGRNGVGLVFSNSSPFQRLQDQTLRYASRPTLSNRYLLVEATLGDACVFIHVVYAPVQATDRATFFANLPKEFPDGAHHLFFGDFNLTLDPNFDQVDPGDRNHDSGRTELHEWMLALGLVDTWRLFNPQAQEFTGPQRRHRIDLCLVSYGFFDNFVRSSRHVPGRRFHHEDHLPVEVQLASHNRPTSAHQWKCPTWLLQLDDVRHTLEANLDRLSTCLRRDGNPGCLLDGHKRADRRFLQRKYQEHRLRFQRELDHLRQATLAAELRYRQNRTDLLAAEVQRCRDTYSSHLRHVHELQADRKFHFDLHQSEQSSKLFFRPTTSPEMKLQITSVRLPYGTVSENLAVISQTHRQYWGTLFQSPTRDLPTSPTTWDRTKLNEILEASTHQVSPDDSRLLDAPIAANDVFFAIQHTAKGKSPGPDGLPAEYYQLFPEKWAPVLELVYASQWRKERMTKFQRRAHIRLLFKDGDRADPKNYPPITLINQDAKFVSKILAHRLNQVLPSVIADEQFGFVPGRDIRHALRLFHDLQDYARQKLATPAGAICLDFAKAFDSVHWDALNHVLQSWGIGEVFRSWVQTLFQGTLVQVLVNNTPSQFFELGAGVRQGDPLSPGLFILFIEPRLEFLRKQHEDMAIKLPSSSHDLISFADDVTGIVNDLRHARQFLADVHAFCQASGIRLNVHKTVVVPFAPWRQEHQDLVGDLTALGVKVLGSDDSTRPLGVLVGPSVTGRLQLDNLLRRVQTLCVQWRWRARTLRGRVLLLKTVILPVVWHFLNAVAVDPDWLIPFDVLVRNFLNQHPSQAPLDPPSRGVFPSSWFFVSARDGGLGLATMTESLQPLRLGLRRSLLRACRQRPGRLPHWFQPALALINEALADEGTGLDILYVHIEAPLHRRWLVIPKLWLQVFAAWTTLLPRLRLGNP